jgi:hypothetical protein
VPFREQTDQFRLGPSYLGQPASDGYLIATDLELAVMVQGQGYAVPLGALDDGEGTHTSTSTTFGVA